MKCHRCKKPLSGHDRVVVVEGKTVCFDCGRDTEPVVFTNGARALRAARRQALAYGVPVSIVLQPDGLRRRTKYYVRVKHRKPDPTSRRGR